MKKTYLCGGINGLSDSDCVDWRTRAKELLSTETLDPMRRDYRGKEDDSFEDIVHNDISDIVQCEYVLVNASRPSWGTAMEIVYAHKMRKFIIAFTESSPRISPWLRFHCHCVKTIEDAVALINAMEGML